AARFVIKQVRGSGPRAGSPSPRNSLQDRFRRDHTSQIRRTMMVKQIAIGAALAACAAFVPQVQVNAQRAGTPAQRTGGQTTSGAAAYPTDEQWKESKPAQALVAKARAAAGSDPYLQTRFDKMCTALGPQNVGTLLRN